MATEPAGQEQVHPQGRDQWREWLADHAVDRAGVWVVFWRRGSGRGGLTYEEAVEEALCFGWIDSVPKKLDENRTLLYFSPRRRGSAWSRPNKQRVERLRAAGLMTEAGLRVVAQAQQDGSWVVLDEVEDLVVPPDLGRALAARPPAREHWDGFPRSVRRGILEWIVQAKRPQTRARRVEETAELAQRGERAHQWRRPEVT